MEQKMKTVGRQMSICMGITLSFALSLTGNLSSGKFTLPGFLSSFVISTLISLVIGFLVPMKKLTDGAEKKAGVQPNSLKARLLDALISDLLYTPIITLVMIILAHRSATAHGAHIPFLPMFLKGLVLSMVVGYVLIFLLMPAFLKWLMKRNGMQGGGRR